MDPVTAGFQFGAALCTLMATAQGQEQMKIENSVLSGIATIFLDWMKKIDPSVVAATISTTVTTEKKS